MKKNDQSEVDPEFKYGFAVKAFDTEKQYSYERALTLASCPTCNRFLRWEISIEKEDDRFCYAICCGIRYSMVPEVVRIVSKTDSQLLFNFPEEYSWVEDDDFFKELMDGN